MSKNTPDTIRQMAKISFKFSLSPRKMTAKIIASTTLNLSTSAT